MLWDANEIVEQSKPCWLHLVWQVTGIHHPDGSYASLVCEFPQEGVIISVHINLVQIRYGWTLLSQNRSGSGATWDSLIPLQCRLASTTDVRHVETNYFWANFNFSLNLIDEATKVDQGRFPANIFPILQYLFMGCLLDIFLATFFHMNVPDMLCLQNFTLPHLHCHPESFIWGHIFFLPDVDRMPVALIKKW